MTEMAIIAAAARVILMLCEDQSDAKTKLDHIAHAAALIQCHAHVGLEKIDSTEEVCHV